MDLLPFCYLHEESCKKQLISDIGRVDFFWQIYFLSFGIYTKNYDSIVLEEQIPAIRKSGYPWHIRIGQQLAT